MGPRKKQPGKSWVLPGCIPQSYTLAGVVDILGRGDYAERADLGEIYDKIIF